MASLLSSELSDSSVWLEHELRGLDIDMLSLPSSTPAVELNWQHSELIDDEFVLPSAAVVSPVKERCISITSRKRRRVEAPPPSPTLSTVSTFSGRSSVSGMSSQSGHESIIDSLDSCRTVLKRVKTKKWCEEHCSAKRQLCKESPVRPGLVVYVFK